MGEAPTLSEPAGRREALERTVEWERAQPHESNPLDYAAEDAALAARMG